MPRDSRDPINDLVTQAGWHADAVAARQRPRCQYVGQGGQRCGRRVKRGKAGAALNYCHTHAREADSATDGSRTP